MATIRIALTDPNLKTGTVTRDFFRSGRRRESRKLAQLFTELACGHRSSCTLKVQMDDSSTSAAGTVTAASVQAADTVTIGNVVLTSHASTNTGLFFALGASDTACATNLAAAINRHAVLSKFMTATSALGVVTLTVGQYLGAVGNLITLTSSNNTRLAVSAFASGADATVTTYNS